LVLLLLLLLLPASCCAQATAPVFECVQPLLLYDCLHTLRDKLQLLRLQQVFGQAEPLAFVVQQELSRQLLDAAIAAAGVSGPLLALLLLPSAPAGGGRGGGGAFAG
jgi:hypothetical protein